jgi:hypothetical protein
MRSAIILLAFGFAALMNASTEALAQSLKGSRGSLDLQNRIAKEHDFTFTRSTAQVKRFVSSGYLVPVRSNGDFHVKRISHPYARPEVALFIERLGRQYRAACGELLVITSLTRPTNRQPRNASSRSVHPTGMAMDVRRSTNRNCRAWLERNLLQLEGAGVIEATRENRPPHYHIAVFPRQYSAYVERKLETGEAEPRLASTAEERRIAEYRVRRGDSLWSIAERHGTSISDLRAANDLRSSRIYAGQVLTMPAGK